MCVFVFAVFHGLRCASSVWLNRNPRGLLSDLAPSLWRGFAGLHLCLHLSAEHLLNLQRGAVSGEVSVTATFWKQRGQELHSWSYRPDHCRRGWVLVIVISVTVDDVSAPLRLTVLSLSLGGQRTHTPIIPRLSLQANGKSTLFMDNTCST